MTKILRDKPTTNLPVTPVELIHLQWALQMDIDINEEQLNEKKALLKRIIQLERATRRSERGPSKRSRKGNVVNIKTGPRAEADTLDKPAS